MLLNSLPIVSLNRVTTMFFLLLGEIYFGLVNTVSKTFLLICTSESFSTIHISIT